MFCSKKSVNRAYMSAIGFTAIMYTADQIGNTYFWGGLFYFIFMLISFYLQDNYRLSKQPSYESAEFLLKFSQTETILKLNEVFYVMQFGDALLVQDINISLQFLEKNRVLVTGIKKNVLKLQSLLSLENDAQNCCRQEK